MHTRYGPPEVVHVVDAPDPQPGPGEVLVAVRATTVNRTDCAYRSARPFFMRLLTGLRGPKLTIGGTEFAGVVAGLGASAGSGAGVGKGEGARSFEVGDRVFGYCEGRFGAHAEYLVVHEDGSLATMPEGLPYAEAAAATEGAHYARSAIRRAGVEAGNHVLVNGATGGIGSAAVQLLKAAGATVTAVCAGEHGELVRGLGADHLIDYTTDDFTADSGRYDVVIDAVGTSSFGRCRGILEPGGVYVSSELGPGWQNLPLALVGTVLRGRRRVVFPFPDDDRSVVEELREHLASGTFRPVIDRTYRLEEIAEAHRYVESGRKIGNVVVTLDRPE